MGDGTTILVDKDPWVPCQDNPMITLSHPVLESISVANLMILGQLEWDLEVIHDVFNVGDARLILNIPLSHSRLEDSWFWGMEHSGRFTVKSTYRFLQQRFEASENAMEAQIWKPVRSLSVPPKVHSLMWRAASSCLPTKAQLRTK